MHRKKSIQLYNFSYLLILRAYNLTVFTCHVDYHRILLHSSLFRNLNQKNRSLSVQLLIFLLVRPEFYLILCSSVTCSTQFAQNSRGRSFLSFLNSFSTESSFISLFSLETTFFSASKFYRIEFTVIRWQSNNCVPSLQFHRQLLMSIFLFRLWP